MAVKKTQTDADPRPVPETAPPGLLDDAIQPLVEHKPAFRSFLRRRVNDTALAEDLLQQSFVRAIERHHALHQNKNVVPWFYRILRHVMADYYRSQASDVRKHEAFLHALTAPGEDTAALPDDVKPTVCACLNKLLLTIRPNYAELIRRIDLEGESPQVVAQALHLIPNNLTVRLHRARRALRASQEESCGICSKHGCLNCACE